MTTDTRQAVQDRRAEYAFHDDLVYLHEAKRGLTRETIEASAMAVTLGCGEECPYVPGVTYVDWPVADPGGQDETTVRAIIADIDARVRRLLVELVPDIELPPSVLS